MMDRQVIFKYTLLGAVYISFLILFWPFKTSLTLAALFAMAMTPLLDRWLKKTDKEKLLIFAMVAGLILIFIAPLTLIITKGILNISQLKPESFAELPVYKNIQDTLNTTWHFFSDIADRLNINMREDIDIQSLLPRVIQFVVPWLTALITNFPEFLLQLFIFITTLYFFLLKRREFLVWFHERRLLPEDSLKKLVGLMQKVCYTVVFSTLIVAAVQAVIVTIGASIAGFGSLMIIFILTFFCSFLPVLGTVPVALPLAAFSLLKGDVGSGIVMLAALGIAGTIDNVIRAYILSGEEESVHPLVSLITLIGALAMFGIPGLFLGPIIAELAYSIGQIMNSGANGSSVTELPPTAISATENAPKPQGSP